MIYGYARVSSTDQNEARQLIALKEAGVPEANIYLDKLSGKNFERPAWKKLKRKAKKGDAIFIKSLDRMGRDYKDVQDQWRVLNKDKGVDIVILDMPLLDTRAEKNLVGTLISDIVLQLLAFVAQTERENIRQRQREGIDAALARGVKFGRPQREMPDNFEEVYQDWVTGKISAKNASERCGIPYSTFRLYLIQRKPDDVPMPEPIRTGNHHPAGRKRPERPALFENVYRSYAEGGIHATDAALLLGISVGRFRAYAKEEKERTAR